MDLHPVILAGGHGSRMYPLTETCPKALLPVGNQPLIYYPIKFLESNGFKEVTVVVRKTDVKAISSVLEGLQGSSTGGSGRESIRFIICEAPDGEDVGSADALRILKGRVKSDLLVLTCDLLSNIALHELWDLHITHQSSITMLLVRPDHTQQDDPMKKLSIQSTEQDLIGLTTSGQVVFHSALVDVEDELKLSRTMIKRVPHFVIHSKLLDAHVYIIRRWVLDYLGDQKSISSLKGELIPHLVRRQGVNGPQTEGLRELSIATSDPIELLAFSHSTCPSGTTLPVHSVRCHALTISKELCMRVNTIPLYIEANRMIPQMLGVFQLEAESPSTAPPTRGKGVSGDSLIGNGVQLSDRTSIKRSVVGHHCIVGDKTKIINSIVMDHVLIGEGCTVQGSVLCSHVRLEDKVTLRDCIVGARVIVHKEGEHKGDVLVEDSELDL